MGAIIVNVPRRYTHAITPRRRAYLAHLIRECCDATCDCEECTYDDGHSCDACSVSDIEHVAPKSTCDFAYDNEGSTAGAAYLLRQNLFHLASKAQSMHDVLDDGDPVEDWIEVKVARALRDIEDVADYILYRRSDARGEA